MSILKGLMDNPSMFYVPYIDRDGELVRIGDMMTLQEVEKYIKKHYPKDINKITLKPLFTILGR